MSQSRFWNFFYIQSGLWTKGQGHLCTTLNIFNMIIEFQKKIFVLNICTCFIILVVLWHRDVIHVSASKFRFSLLLASSSHQFCNKHVTWSPMCAMYDTNMYEWTTWNAYVMNFLTIDLFYITAQQGLSFHLRNRKRLLCFQAFHKGRAPDKLIGCEDHFANLVWLSTVKFLL